jgi:hypothetical protein
MCIYLYKLYSFYSYIIITYVYIEYGFRGPPTNARPSRIAGVDRSFEGGSTIRNEQNTDRNVVTMGDKRTTLTPSYRRMSQHSRSNESRRSYTEA